ncbi:MAG: SbcC/MukB-like Walker B domain-containing protein [Burkholderiaceae bacterium]|nr:SbcC/MukB-like Walker B domain-containing protein [Burkholderiaceae bacterium]
MNHSASLGLDFVGDDKLIGWRLRRLEVFNWGTFNRRVWTLKLDGQSGLMTGDIGSGKTSMVDALTTLLVPRVNFNRAATKEVKERHYRSYVLGYYKNAHNEQTGVTRPVGLRDERSYSVILAVFANESFDQTVTLAQVFWFKDAQGQPTRRFICAERDLTIAEDFSAFGADMDQLHKRLKAAGAEWHDNFKSYGAWFMRRFGISDEQALELFHQTVSMKEVTNLTEFVRQHMLEPFDASTRIEQLIQHFDDLDRAHQSVLSARRQIEKLTPLAADCASYRTRQTQIVILETDRDALPVYFAARKVALLDERRIELDTQFHRLDAEVTRLQNLRHEQSRSVLDLDTALRDNGGDRLGQLKAEIEALGREHKQKRQKANEYETLLERVGQQLPIDAEAFRVQHASIAAHIDALEEQGASLRTEASEIGYQIRALGEQENALVREVDSLTKHRNNIEGFYLHTREELCRATGIGPDELPFVGELLRVREEDRDWQGAAERLLRGFAQTMLVPGEHYGAVSTWVNENYLRGRFSYFDLRVMAKTSQPLHPQSIVRKIEIKPDCAHYEWLEQKLRASWDYACCELGESFRREPRAITRAGQIKEPGGRYTKDDTRRLDDRSQYVLGWSNTDKITALNERIEEIRKQGLPLVTRAQEIETARKKRDEQVKSWHQLVVFDDFSAIDWRSVVVRIDALEEEQRLLEEASDVLRTLSEQLEHARKALVETQGRLEGPSSVPDARSRVDQKREDNARDLTAAQALMGQTPLAQPQIERIDVWHEQANGSGNLTLDGCVRAEPALRSWLQKKIGQENEDQKKLATRIVNAMNAFKNDFPLQAADWDASPEAAPEIDAMLERLVHDDLPRFEERFKEALNLNTINEIANFQAQLARERDLIKDRVDIINKSLASIDYNPGRYIVLLLQPTGDAEVRDFQGALRQCTEYGIGASDEGQYSEGKFEQVKAIIDRFRGREGVSDQDRTWTRKVTDVRNWFVFSASERRRSDNGEHENYPDSGGKSGGQKEKLAYTVLAASLAYRFNLKFDEVNPRSFRFVVIDEAFKHGSEESAQHGLGLFRELNLQLLVVTPLEKIHVIEPYVANVGYVYNAAGEDSRLRVLTVEEYRAEEATKKALVTAGEEVAEAK